MQPDVVQMPPALLCRCVGGWRGWCGALAAGLEIRLGGSTGAGDHRQRQSFDMNDVTCRSTYGPSGRLMAAGPPLCKRGCAAARGDSTTDPRIRRVCVKHMDIIALSKLIPSLLFTHVQVAQDDHAVTALDHSEVFDRRGCFMLFILSRPAAYTAVVLFQYCATCEWPSRSLQGLQAPCYACSRAHTGPAACIQHHRVPSVAPL
jgi:hypothetical protein